MTPNQVIAGLQSTRTFCLNAITGDPLASLVRGTVVWDDVSTRGTTTPVEFTAETMAVLMTEAIALVERLEHEVTTLRRALGVPLGETLPTWVQRYAESAPEPPAEPPARQVGDMLTDRIGTRWRVNRIGSVGTVLVNRRMSDLLWELSTVECEYGPLVWDVPEAADAPESDEHEPSGTPTPDNGGYAAYAASMDAEDDAFGRAVRARRRVGTDAPEGPEDDTAPWVPSVGDVCEDQDGSWWKVRELSPDGAALLSMSREGSRHSVRFVSDQWGPLNWGNGQITHGS